MEKYEVICPLSLRFLGRVSKIRRKKDGQLFIWKELNCRFFSSMIKKSIENEINILNKLDHKNIVKYYGYLYNNDGSRIYIIMEYCENGDLEHFILKNYIGKRLTMPEKHIWIIFTQILLGVKYIHTREEGMIIHRDLIPENILIDKNYNVKIGDVGISRESSPNEIYAFTQIGTPLYSSPEKIKGDGYNDKNDIWSLGCILFYLATFKNAFVGRNSFELLKNIENGNLNECSSLYNYSNELREAISWMLIYDPHERPNCFDLFNIPSVYNAWKQLEEMEYNNQKGYCLISKNEKLNQFERELKEKQVKLNNKIIKLNKKNDKLKNAFNDLKKEKKELKEKKTEILKKEKEMKEKFILFEKTKNESLQSVAEREKNVSEEIQKLKKKLKKVNNKENELNKISFELSKKDTEQKEKEKM